MKKMLFVQNVQVTPHKPNKKSEKKRKNLEVKYLNLFFEELDDCTDCAVYMSDFGLRG